jgi:hypothetical protein
MSLARRTISSILSALLRAFLRVALSAPWYFFDTLNFLLSLNYFSSSVKPGMSFEARSLAERGNSANFGASFFGFDSFTFGTFTEA